MASNVTELVLPESLPTRILRLWKRLGKKADKLDARAELARALEFLLSDNLPDALDLLNIVLRIAVDEDLKVIRRDADTLYELALVLKDHQKRLEPIQNPKRIVFVCSAALEILDQSLLIQFQGGGQISADFRFKRAVANVRIAEKKCPRPCYMDFLEKAEQDLKACATVLRDNVAVSGTLADVLLFLERWDDAVVGYDNALCLANKEEEKYVRHGLRKYFETRKRYARKKDRAMDIVALKIFPDWQQELLDANTDWCEGLELRRATSRAKCS